MVLFSGVNTPAAQSDIPDYFFACFRLGRFQYGDLHLLQFFGSCGLRGNQVCPHREHFRVGSFTVVVRPLYTHVYSASIIVLRDCLTGQDNGSSSKIRGDRKLDESCTSNPTSEIADWTA